MVHFHGTPITPESCYSELVSRNFLVSWAYPQQLEAVRETCSSHVFDNGAYSLWMRGERRIDWTEYYRWVEREWSQTLAWVAIPDVIDGDEKQNDALLAEWPHGSLGVPVWHMHESIDRFSRLVDEWPRVAIGSSGAYSNPGTSAWWQRMAAAMDAVCVDGRPHKPLHLMRGLSLDIFPYLPLASADSAQIGVNVGLNANFPGRYAPKDKSRRARAIADYIEQHQAAVRWEGIPMQTGLFEATA